MPTRDVLQKSGRVAVMAALLALLAVVGCGGGGDGADAGRGAEAAAPAGPDVRLAGGPRQALKANAAQADQILGEGVADLESRLAALKGHPVVVNQWASWCPPCRAEMPFFDAATEQYADRVAFLGLDLRDERDAAEGFLAEVPSGFPSIFDPDGEATASLGGGQASPSTFFFSADGRQVHTKIGPYASLKELEADLRRFAKPS